MNSFNFAQQSSFRIANDNQLALRVLINRQYFGNMLLFLKEVPFKVQLHLLSIILHQFMNIDLL